MPFCVAQIIPIYHQPGWFTESSIMFIPSKNAYIVYRHDWLWFEYKKPLWRINDLCFLSLDCHHRLRMHLRSRHCHHDRWVTCNLELFICACAAVYGHFLSPQRHPKFRKSTQSAICTNMAGCYGNMYEHGRLIRQYARTWQVVLGSRKNSLRPGNQCFNDLVQHMRQESLLFISLYYHRGRACISIIFMLFKNCRQNNGRSVRKGHIKGLLAVLWWLSHQNDFISSFDAVGKIAGLPS